MGLPGGSALWKDSRRFHIPLATDKFPHSSTQIPEAEQWKHDYSRAKTGTRYPAGRCSALLPKQRTRTAWGLHREHQSPADARERARAIRCSKRGCCPGLSPTKVFRRQSIPVSSSRRHTASRDSLRSVRPIPPLDTGSYSSGTGGARCQSDGALGRPRVRRRASTESTCRVHPHGLSEQRPRCTRHLHQLTPALRRLFSGQAIVAVLGVPDKVLSLISHSNSTTCELHQCLRNSLDFKPIWHQ